MSEAIVVHNAYKHFGRASQPLWKRLIRTDQALHTQIDPAPTPAADGVVALNRISFNVREGEFFGVVGPSGAGKSTLIRLIAALLRPDDGSISVFGHDVVYQATQAQQMLNQVSMETGFFKKLSPVSNLMYAARLYGMTGPETRSRIIEILLRLGLEESALAQPMEQMERGDQRKVAIARALLSEPRLLLLDEPTAGLEPHAKSAVQDVLSELNQHAGTTILLTTRDLSEAGALCERVALIESGNLVATETLEFAQ